MFQKCLKLGLQFIIFIGKMSSPHPRRGSRTPSRQSSEADGDAPRTPRRTPTRRTPSRSSQSTTPTTTPMRFGGQRRQNEGPDFIVETSDPLSMPPSSPGHPVIQPTSPLAVGKCNLRNLYSLVAYIFLIKHYILLFNFGTSKIK